MYKSLFFVVLCIVSFATIVVADNPPVETKVALSRAFVPIGFDTNDKVELIGTGYFKKHLFRGWAIFGTRSITVENEFISHIERATFT